MKNRHLGLGIFILSIGVLLLLANFGVINWTIWESIFDLWPVLLVMAGINIIFRHNEVVRVITWLAFLALIICYSIFYKGGLSINNSKMDTGKTVKYERKADVESAELKLDLAGDEFTLDSSAADLVNATFTNPNMKSSMEDRNGGKSEYVVFQEKNPFGVNLNSRSQNCSFSVNNSVVWDMDIDAGAINGNMDMSDLKVNNLTLDTGAANIKLVFGNRSSLTNVTIDAGASKIEAYIPHDVGVKVRMKTALCSANLSGLGWTKQGQYYISPNYDSASSKINMELDMGAGKFDVNMQ